MERRIRTYVWFLFISTSTAFAEITVEKFVENNNQLSINMFNEMVKTNNKNFAYSTFCLDAIMALTYLGCRDDTAKEIKNAFDWNVTNPDLSSAFQTAIQELKNGKKLKIHLANKIYLNHHLNIDPKFFQVAEAFDTKIENINFNSTQETPHKINSWLSSQTAKKIGDIADKKHFNEHTDMVLISSLYFRGKWKYPFVTKETKKMDFLKSENETVEVDVMKITSQFLLDKNPSLGIRMLRIPYKNEKADMLIILPDNIKDFHNVENHVDKLWENRNFKRTHLTVHLPKFSVKYCGDMIPILKKMGVSKLFSNADLSGITKDDVNVSAIIQKLSVSVDEIGTESIEKVPDDNLEANDVLNQNEEVEVFKVDHPFVFAIMYDGFSLLTGRYSGPEKE